ncbi:MAG: TolB family protein [Chlamydiia bacterium]|nr:TolB family protein [Chlamydiia bacterium]
MLLLFFNILFACVWADEPYLQNIEQLTYPDMGFEKAGEAYFNPSGDKISFQAVPTGESDYQIFTLSLNDKKLTRISPELGACTCSFFHPKKPKILFAMSPFKAAQAAPGSYKWDFTPFMNIYECDLDGDNLTQLTFGPAYHAECAYSPDGEKICFASDLDGSMNLYVMNSDGTDIRQITHTKGSYNGGPFFSPDGKSLIFRADYDEPHRLQLYKINIDGSNLTRLTDDPHVNWAPFWHPSGKAIAYTTSKHGHHQYQLYLMRLDTFEAVRITDHPSFNGLPTFNTDGSKLLWTSKRGSDQTSQIFIADFIPPFEDL